MVSPMTAGELDLHLFGEGRHRRLWEWMGAQPGEDGTSFAVWAPNAREVEVVGDWSGWVAGTTLEPNGDSGVWTGSVPDGEGRPGLQVPHPDTRWRERAAGRSLRQVGGGPTGDREPDRSAVRSRVEAR